MLLRYQICGTGNPFEDKLREFGLKDAFSNYSLLVKYNWLRPAFHVTVPDEWMQHKIETSTRGTTPDTSQTPWAWYYDAQWWIEANEIGTDAEWFVHPFFRNGSTRVAFFDHSVSTGDDFEWQKKTLPNGLVYVSAFDYFYEWQLLRFADIVNFAKGQHPHFWRPGQYQSLVQHANTVSIERFDREIPLARWERWKQPFRWVSHFIAFRETFDQYANDETRTIPGGNIDQETATRQRVRDERAAGAIGLANWLGIQQSDLETALQSCFLELASDWQGPWNRYDKTAARIPLWRSLQKHTMACAFWLSLLSGRNLTHYLETFSYPRFQNPGWARLEDVLNYPEWKSARAASEFILSSSKPYEARGIDFSVAFPISPTKLIDFGEAADSLDAYVNAMWRFDTESRHTKDDDPFRPRSRASWYRLMAISADTFLRDARQKHFPSLPNGIKGVVEALGCDGGLWESRMKSIEGAHSKNGDRLAESSSAIRSSSTHQDLVIGFALAFYFLRNTLAHDASTDLDLLHAIWAGPVLDSVVVFAPWALFKMIPTPPPTSL